MTVWEICENLENIVPNIRWDPEGCMAIEEAVEVLRKIEQEREKQIDIRPAGCMVGKEATK